jgi:GAF domain-containing protein
MSSETREQQILRGVRKLGAVVASEATTERALRRITELVSDLVPGADHVGISIAEGGPIETLGASDEIAHAVDRIQHELGEGPCLESLEQDEIFRVEDAESDQRWPRFSAEVRARTPVRSTLAVMLFFGNESIGALNLYGDKAHAFEPDDDPVAAILASQAAVVVGTMKRRAGDATKIENLHQALSTREVIGQAKGILMARENCTDEEAFAMLSAASQKLNVKLREIAQIVVDDTEADAKAP